MNVLEFPLFQQVALIYNELDLELVGLIGKTWFVEQLFLLVVDFPFWLSINSRTQIPLSNRDVARSLVKVEVTCMFFI